MEKFNVNAGFLKGRKIEGVNDKRTRYTPSKVKHSVFSILNAYAEIEGASFLDLCAASGQMGIEAISRGGTHTTFVDLSPLSIKSLKKNVLDLKIDDQVRIVKQDVLRFIKKTEKKYDIVFIDTPFVESIYLNLVSALLEQKGILSDNGVIVVETQKRFKRAESAAFDLANTYDYGTIRIDLYKHKDELTEEESQ